MPNNNINLVLEYLKAQVISIKAASGGLFIRRQERRMAKKLTLIWENQMKYVVERLATFSAFKSHGMITKDFDSEMNALLVGMPDTRLLVDVLIQYIGIGMQRGGNDRIKEYDLGQFGISFDLASLEAQIILDARRRFELSPFKGTISSTTNQKIVEIVQTGLKDGLSYSEIAQKIVDQTKSGVFSYARGQLIATTEIGRAYGKGSLQMMTKITSKTGRRVNKKWISVGDLKVRTPHTINQEQGWIEVTQRFIGTGDVQAPSEKDFNCRCTMGFEIV